MSEPKTYYIEVISSEEMYDGTHWQRTVENSPCLYHDEKGEASDVTHMVAALRAEVERLRKALGYITDISEANADRAIVEMKRIAHEVLDSAPAEEEVRDE